MYRRALRILGNPADADEATQEIFLRALRASDAFEHRSQMTTWLYQITTNYCLNALRDRHRRQDLSSEHLSQAPRADSPHAEDMALVRDLLSRADERQALAVVYVFIDGMSHDEAAALLSVSKRTVGNLIERFRAYVDSQSGIEPVPLPLLAGSGERS